MKTLYKIDANVRGIGRYTFYLVQTTLNTDDMKRQIRKFMSENKKIFNTTDEQLHRIPVDLLNISVKAPLYENDTIYNYIPEG